MLDKSITEILILQLMSGSREIIDMNLGPVESKRVSSASSLEGETTPDEKRGIHHLVLSNLYLKKLLIPKFFLLY